MSGPTIAIIGGGNMAWALVGGSVRARAMRGAEWLVVEPDELKRERFARLGAATVSSAGELGAWLGEESQVLLAVKPQSLEVVGSQVGRGVMDGRVVITILAGMASARVREVMGGGCRVVRAMPNTPAALGLGATAVALGAGAREGDDARAVELFGAVGPVVERIDESLMDAFTALAGSGPAYVFYLAEAMERAAVEVGFDRAAAARIVRQVLAGSAAMLSSVDGGIAPDAVVLRGAVTSKGGTTEAAVRVLDEAKVMEVVVRAITAARDRGRELGRG